jgi:type IX secretion system PorP/SprF family membrane protein
MKKIITIFTALMISGLLFSQDPQISQFYASPTILAPSLAGTTMGSRIGLNFRDQWPAIPGSFITYSLAFDHFFPKTNSGVGVFFIKDKAGIGNLATTNTGMQYSYKIVASRAVEVRPAIQLYYSQRSADFYRHTFSDQISFSGIAPVTSETAPFEKVGYMDVAASVFAYSEKYWGGIVLDHLVKPNQSLFGGNSEVPVLFKFFGGAKYIIDQSVGNYIEESITATFLYKSQGKYDQFDIGAYWSKFSFVAGFWYRGLPGIKAHKKGYGNSDAVTILAGYKWEDVKIGYTYDFTISKLINSTNGSHEISMIYEFNQDQKQKKGKNKIVVPCPKF